MCTTNTVKSEKTETAVLNNQYLDGSAGATGLSIGRKQLRSGGNSTATNASSAQVPATTGVAIGLGTR